MMMLSSFFICMWSSKGFEKCFLLWKGVINTCTKDKPYTRRRIRHVKKYFIQYFLTVQVKLIVRTVKSCCIKYFFTVYWFVITVIVLSFSTCICTPIESPLGRMLLSTVPFFQILYCNKKDHMQIEWW